MSFATVSFLRYSFFSLLMNANQRELLDERVASRRKIQFGHMRRVASGEVDLEEPFGTTPPALRPEWTKRKSSRRSLATQVSLPLNL
ncbi:MAG: hypothetical protein UX89_C0023G0003 [Parcubacteria group bacterium GW2011_GWA2_47_16]|nr:MAG: hypothetical protein UX89_C0023G0003 [Parcubacteria group bacterium GW2011_GWA2_47_16]